MSRADDVELYEILEAMREELVFLRRGQASTNRRLDQIMVSQADLDQIAQRIAAAENSQAAALDVIKTGIAALQQANPSLDLSGLLNEAADAEQRSQDVQDVAAGLSNPNPPVSETP